MHVLIASTAILSLIAAFATSAGAQTVKQFQLVGFSETTTMGDTGVLGMTQMCQETYEASRMCTAAEVGQTVEPPTITGGGRAWVQPTSDPRTAETDNWTCNGWSNNASSANGLAVTPWGAFYSGNGCNESHPVACCALIAVPEPSTTLLQGAAAATLGTLAAKRTPRTTASTEPSS